jgi:hypothetical protein
VLAARRNKIVSPIHWPASFIRGPFIAWQTPRAFRSDMHGPGLSALFLDLLTGGTGKTRVLHADGPNLSVSPAARKDAVDKLLGR